MRVAVTGAAGYIGRHVVRRLLEYGHEVIAIDFVNDGIPADAEYRRIDILRSGAEVWREMGEPEVCIHMAWKDGFVHNAVSHIELLSAHFDFLKNLIDGGCKNIAVMGRMHEVGFWEGPIDEHTPCHPLSQYGVAKNALRESLLLYAQNKDVNIYWLRAYYILGDDLRNNSIFTKLLLAAEEGKKTFPFTTGKNRYDFLSVEDLAAQIALASTQREITGIINVCSGNPVPLADKVEEFIREHQLDIQLEYGAFPDRSYDSRIVYGDDTKIREIMKAVG